MRWLVRVCLRSAGWGAVCGGGRAKPGGFGAILRISGSPRDKAGRWEVSDEKDRPLMHDELGQRRTVIAARAKLREALEHFAEEPELPPSEATAIEELVVNRMREIVAEEAGAAALPQKEEEEKP